ncbi:hypothetical protein HPB50_001646 [Hyalomma asiaticum]|uniref:Uncharacterized protein n=1 Tax=Hyalomma asiaticum TaxID=266040 RepID=A0ACB7RQH3_HYAAI|nr:hypothetical protein HPB50_001646 [Hyalomma asiaticum]
MLVVTVKLHTLVKLGILISTKGRAASNALAERVIDTGHTINWMSVLSLPRRETERNLIDWSPNDLQSQLPVPPGGVASLALQVHGQAPFLVSAAALPWPLKRADADRAFKSAGCADVDEGIGWSKRWNGVIQEVETWALGSAAGTAMRGVVDVDPFDDAAETAHGHVSNKDEICTMKQKTFTTGPIATALPWSL